MKGKKGKNYYMSKKKKNTFKKILSILACVALLAITVIPVNNIYADDENTNNNSENIQENYDADNNNNEEIDNQEEDENITDPKEELANNEDNQSSPSLSEGPAKTRGSGVTITASITDEENNAIDFSNGTSGEQAVAKLGTSTSATGFSYPYVVNVTFSGFSSSDVTDKEVEIILDGKLLWGDDGSTIGQTPDALDQSKGTNGVTTSDGFELDGKPLKQSKIYHIKKDTAGFSLLFTVGLHKNIAISEMSDPIKIIVREDGEKKGETKLDKAIDIRPVSVYYPGDGSNLKTTLDNNSTTPLTKGAVPHGRAQGTYANGNIHLLNEKGTAIVTFTVSNPDAILKMRRYDSPQERGVFTFDDSRKEEGVYKLIIKDRQYLHISENYSSIDYFYLYFPSDKFKVGDSATVTVTSDITHYNPYDENGINVKHEGTFTYSVVEKSADSLSITSSIYNNYINKDNLDYGLGNKSYATIGYFVVKNTAQDPTEPKIVEYRFNGANEGVRGIYLQGNNLGSNTKKFSYTTNKSEEETTVTATLASGGDGGSVPIHFASGIDVFNLSEGEYLKSVKIYEDEGIPTGNKGYAFYGRVFDNSKKTTLEMRIYNQDEKWDSENALKANLEVNYTHNQPFTYSQNIPADVHVNAGETKKILTIDTYSMPGVIQRPVYYFVVRAKDENGKFLKLKDITLSSAGYAGSKLATQSVMDYVQEYIAKDGETEIGRVYKLDTTKLPGGQYDSIRPIITENETTIKTYYKKRFELVLETTLATPDQNFPFSTMCYYEDGLNVGDSTIPNGISDRKTSTGKTYLGGAIRGYAGGGLENSYFIHGVSDLEVNTYGKHHSSQDWISWNEGNEPIAVGNKSSFDIKVDVINGSEKDIAGPVYVYVPIPKEGEEWGEMTHETEDDPFEFDVKLNSVTIDGKVSELPAGSYKIEYASVEPSHHGDDLALEDWTKSIDDPDINCIRISLSNLPANESGSPDGYSFIFNCEALNPQAEGLINTFRPRYYKAVPGLESWSYGSYISLETALGEVRGKMFLDENMDGKYDAGDKSIENKGVKLVVHDKNNEKISEVETDANGEYLFVDLKTKDEYVIKVANPDIDKYIFTRLGTPNTKDVFNTDNQFTGHNDDAEGLSTTVYPKMEDPENDYLTPSVYNIGLLDVNTETTITFDANGGKIGDKETVELKGKPIATLTKPSNPKKTGSTFHYWYLADDTQMKEATIPTTFGFDDLTFKAYYEDINYTVKYETDGGTTIDDKKNVKWNDNGLAPTTNPEKEHYTFEGWYIDDEFTTKYNNQKYSEIVEDDEVLIATLYANYTPVEYTITYTELGDGKNDDNNPTTYTIEDEDIEFLDPIKNKTGYLFDTWDPNIIKSGSSGNKTIVAKWTPITYTIKFVGGEDATGDPFERSAEYDVTQEAPDNDVFEKKGNDFIGWEDKNGNVYQPGDELKNLSSTQDDTVTLTAKWEEFYYYYSIGANSTWTKGSNVPGVFKVTRNRLDKPTINLDNPTTDKDILYTFDKFIRIEIDEEVVDPKEYDAIPGSVRISINPSYLEKLKDGEHYLTTVLSDGSVTTKFTIKPKPVVPTPPKPSPYNLPKTGVDAMPHSLNTSLVSLALLGVVAAVAKKKTK